MGKQDDEIMVLPPQYEKSTEVIQTLERIDSVTEIDEREPTDEELATLRRVSETIPIRAWYTLV
jgi:PleD family two-component response regulator